jgi:hypothetical protein
MTAKAARRVPGPFGELSGPELRSDRSNLLTVMRAIKGTCRPWGRLSLCLALLLVFFISSRFASTNVRRWRVACFWLSAGACRSRRLLFLGGALLTSPVATDAASLVETV